MKVRIAQLAVSKNIDENSKKILDEISRTGKDEWIVFPEAILSGYYPSEEKYTECLDWDKIEGYLQEIEHCVLQMQCHCLLGSATKIEGQWFNSTYFLSYANESKRHDKKHLSKLDRKHFSPGKKAENYILDNINFAMLACRELIMPQEWIDLKKQGVQVVFHLNNAIQPHDVLWKHILITRAIENSIFVVSVNNGEKPQKLGSYIIGPGGKIIAETKVQCEETICAEIDLTEVIGNLEQREDY